MGRNKMYQILRISKMYYELNLTQIEIAAKEGISKSTVSRLLQEAMETGLIEVKIKEYILSFDDLEKELISLFPIKRAIIVPDLVSNRQVLTQDVCAALIHDLPRYVKNDSIVGVHWGNTLAVLSKSLKRIKRQGVSVIQLSGGFSRAIYESGSLDILKRFVDAFAATGYQIPAPAMVDKAFIADAIKQDHQVKSILDMAEECDTAIFSVGNLERPSVLYQMGIINEENYVKIKQKGGIGDCCSHFLDKNGNVLDLEMDKRVVAASIETIKKIKNKLLVAVGIEKAEIIMAALKNGLADNLYIDEKTAIEIIRLSSSNDKTYNVLD